MSKVRTECVSKVWVKDKIKDTITDMNKRHYQEVHEKNQLIEKLKQESEDLAEANRLCT